MGPMEKRFEACLDTEVKAFRQTYASCSLTGSGITNVLAGRRKLVAVFEGTKWFRPYTEFLDNYHVYHHLAMSTRPLGERGLATLENTDCHAGLDMTNVLCDEEGRLPLEDAKRLVLKNLRIRPDVRL